MTLKLKPQLAISVAVLVTSVVIAGYALGSIRSQAQADVARIRAEKTAQVKQDLADKVNTVYALIDAHYREAADERYLEQKYGERLEAILDLAGATLREHLARARRGEVPPRARRRTRSRRSARCASTAGKGYPDQHRRPALPEDADAPDRPDARGFVLDAPEFDLRGRHEPEPVPASRSSSPRRGATASSATAGPSRMGRSSCRTCPSSPRPPVRGVMGVDGHLR